MDKVPLGLGKRGYALMLAIAAVLGGLLFGYDTSVISGAFLFVRQQFHLISVETEVAVSIVLAGQPSAQDSAAHLAIATVADQC